MQLEDPLIGRECISTTFGAPGRSEEDELGAEHHGAAGRRVSGLPKEARCAADVQPSCPEANARGATISLAELERKC